MSRNTKIVITVSAMLFIAAAILAWLNYDNISQKKAIQKSGTFFISANSQEHTVSMDDILSLPSRSVKVNAKSSSTDYTNKVFTCVSFKSLLDYIGADYSKTQSITFTSSDGYASAIPISDALDEDNCFIAVHEDGKPLGTKESGGSGPFRMILAKDEFSKRWCKFLLEIRLS